MQVHLNEVAKTGHRTGKFVYIENLYPDHYHIKVKPHHILRIINNTRGWKCQSQDGLFGTAFKEINMSNFKQNKRDVDHCKQRKNI